MAPFYQSPEEKPQEGSPSSPRGLSLSDDASVFKTEFNTMSYLAVGLSLIALLMFGILMFRPPKPEAELRKLNEAQAQIQSSLEQIEGRIATMSRWARKLQEGDVATSLRIALMTLNELQKEASPEIRSQAEDLQAKIRLLLGEIEEGRRP
jgi:hypothetical protein